MTALLRDRNLFWLATAVVATGPAIVVCDALGMYGRDDFEFRGAVGWSMTIAALFGIWVGMAVMAKR